MVSYGISRGTVVNIVAMVSEPTLENTSYEGAWARECTREEFLGQFEEWEDEVEELLQVSLGAPTALQASLLTIC